MRILALLLLASCVALSQESDETESGFDSVAIGSTAFKDIETLTDQGLRQKAYVEIAQLFAKLGHLRGAREASRSLSKDGGVAIPGRVAYHLARAGHVDTASEFMRQLENRQERQFARANIAIAQTDMCRLNDALKILKNVDESSACEQALYGMAASVAAKGQNEQARKLIQKIEDSAVRKRKLQHFPKEGPIMTPGLGAIQPNYPGRVLHKISVVVANGPVGAAALKPYKLATKKECQLAKHHIRRIKNQLKKINDTMSILRVKLVLASAWAVMDKYEKALSEIRDALNDKRHEVTARAKQVAKAIRFYCWVRKGQNGKARRGQKKLAEQKPKLGDLAAEAIGAALAAENNHKKFQSVLKEMTDTRSRIWLRVGAAEELIESKLETFDG